MTKREILARVVRICEALADGDLALASAIADDLERDLNAVVTDRPFRCPRCTARFRWPGELDHHLTFAHPDLEKLDRAA